MRRQGFSGPAMLPYAELEYGGIVDILKHLDPQFRVRPPAATAKAAVPTAAEPAKV